LIGSRDATRNFVEKVCRVKKGIGDL